MTDLTDIQFDDMDGANRRLTVLLEEDHPGLEENLAWGLSESADPGTVLVGLERFLESVEASGLSRDEELKFLGFDSRYVRMVCRVFDQSFFLTDILCRNPQYARWLAYEATLGDAVPREAMLADLSKWVESCQSIAEYGEAMRRWRQREILRIAVRDIFVHSPVASLTQDISNLADTALEMAYRVGHAALEKRYGRPVSEHENTQSDVTFVIIGMGKLGGSELNFSSDVDPIFVYSDEGETTGGTSGRLSTLDFFQKLGEYIIQLVSEVTAEGHIFRVDMRLRPYGRVSPLAVSMGRAIEYYGGYAQPWERQAMIKARPVAGDMALGERFIEQTRPFVFPRYFDDETLDAIRQIKLQMEAQIAERNETELDVKLGRGGIRDIEFTVQMLQMLNGGRMPDLRNPNTLEAIQVLGLRGHLTPFEATALASNYAFMRKVEHRLQIEGGQQRHVLPNAPEKLEHFARRLGYVSAESFMTDYRDRTEETRGILQRFLSTEGSGRQWTYDLLSPHASGEIGKAHLVQYGFNDPDRARHELIQLSAGPEQQPYAFHVRQQFAEIVPTLLEALGETVDPDATLIRFGRMLTSLGAPGAIYETLRHNLSFCRYLVTLVSNSEYLSEILIRDPGLFDVFGSGDALDTEPTREELEQELAILSRAADAAAAPYRLRDSETLRVGMRELFREITVLEVGRELTLVAEVCLHYALEKARADVEQRYGKANGAFAILGLGKFGGREMGYGSDLDLVFVYEAEATTESGMAPSEYFAAVAAKVIQRLKESTRYGFLYDIDARLRPDGKKGTLAVSDRRLFEYYEQEAQTWELLALVKVRAVAGDGPFAADIERRVQELAFSLTLSTEHLAQIEDMQQRIAQGRSSLDLKKSTGGLVEVEFVVRLLQTRYVSAYPELKRSDVMGALDLLAKIGALSSWDLAVLKDAYLLFRRVENRIRMMNGRATSRLPEEPEARAELAKRLNIEQDLLDMVEGHEKAVHSVFQNVLRDLGSGPCE